MIILYNTYNTYFQISPSLIVCLSIVSLLSVHKIGQKQRQGCVKTPNAWGEEMGVAFPDTCIPPSWPVRAVYSSYFTLLFASNDELLEA